ncbi:MAG: hypothetical protein GF320_11020 [Armatimonadia bacterium]|nr:hypothetical protein [Armatimonadia bacterium]
MLPQLGQACLIGLGPALESGAVDPELRDVQCALLRRTAAENGYGLRGIIWSLPGPLAMETCKALLTSGYVQGVAALTLDDLGLEREGFFEWVEWLRQHNSCLLTTAGGVHIRAGVVADHTLGFLARLSPLPEPLAPRASGVGRGWPTLYQRGHPVVMRILKWRSEGITLREIAERLNGEAILTSRGNQWGISSVSALIRRVTHDSDEPRTASHDLDANALLMRFIDDAVEEAAGETISRCDTFLAFGMYCHGHGHANPFDSRPKTFTRRFRVAARERGIGFEDVPGGRPAYRHLRIRG